MYRLFFSELTMHIEGDEILMGFLSRVTDNFFVCEDTSPIGE